ncbi:GAF domain-containing protein [Lysobacter korlensis]|uniref:GAF domain-containing protein n=1 Tax=Lysobacter korlensis TaxID=553636 RepID=A0ABV6RJZ3_9GAMM
MIAVAFCVIHALSQRGARTSAVKPLNFGSRWSLPIALHIHVHLIGHHLGGLMLDPALPQNETRRLQVLQATGFLGPGLIDDLQPYVRIARALCNVPIAAVSLIDRDRQWFKAMDGLDVEGTPRRFSFCAHAILQKGVFYISDATHDERFADNPLVLGDPGIRFYAGCPLFIEDDLGMGALMVIDRRPRTLDADTLLRLRDLADCVQRALSHRMRLAIGSCSVSHAPAGQCGFMA